MKLGISDQNTWIRFFNLLTRRCNFSNICGKHYTVQRVQVLICHLFKHNTKLATVYDYVSCSKIASFLHPITFAVLDTVV